MSSVSIYFAVVTTPGWIVCVRFVCVCVFVRERVDPPGGLNGADKSKPSVKGIMVCGRHAIRSLFSHGSMTSTTKDNPLCEDITDPNNFCDRKHWPICARSLVCAHACVRVLMRARKTGYWETTKMTRRYWVCLSVRLSVWVYLWDQGASSGKYFLIRQKLYKTKTNFIGKKMIKDKWDACQHEACKCMPVLDR